MANRTIIIGSSYPTDMYGPYRPAVSTDTIVDGAGNAITANIESFVTKTADYPLTTSDHTVLVDATSASILLTLPTAVGNSGLHFEIKRIDGIEAKTVTVACVVNIDNQTSIGLIPYASIKVLSDGAKWWIL